MFDNHDNDDLPDFNAEQPDNADLTLPVDEVTAAEPEQPADLAARLTDLKARYVATSKEVDEKNAELGKIRAEFKAILADTANASPKLATAFSKRTAGLFTQGDVVNWPNELTGALQEVVLDRSDAL